MGCSLLLAERGDVSAHFDDPLAAIMVLVQLIEEVLKDGLKHASGLRAFHIGIRLGM